MHRFPLFQRLCAILLFGAVASAPAKACDDGHWIDEVLADGQILKLEDETITQVRKLLGLATPAAEEAVEIDPAAAQPLAQPARAVAVACSSSRPSMPAANHATGRRQ